MSTINQLECDSSSREYPSFPPFSKSEEDILDQVKTVIANFRFKSINLYYNTPKNGREDKVRSMKYTVVEVIVLYYNVIMERKFSKFYQFVTNEDLVYTGYKDITKITTWDVFSKEGIKYKDLRITLASNIKGSEDNQTISIEQLLDEFVEVANSYPPSSSTSLLDDNPEIKDGNLDIVRNCSNNIYDLEINLMPSSLISHRRLLLNTKDCKYADVFLKSTFDNYESLSIYPLPMSLTSNMEDDNLFSKYFLYDNGLVIKDEKKYKELLVGPSPSSPSSFMSKTDAEIEAEMVDDEDNYMIESRILEIQRPEHLATYIENLREQYMKYTGILNHSLISTSMSNIVDDLLTLSNGSQSMDNIDVDIDYIKDLWFKRKNESLELTTALSRLESPPSLQASVEEYLHIDQLFKDSRIASINKIISNQIYREYIKQLYDPNRSSSRKSSCDSYFDTPGKMFMLTSTGIGLNTLIGVVGLVVLL